MRKLTLLMIIMTLSAITVPARIWTLQNGQTVDGEVHRIEGKWIVVSTADGEKRPINISHLVKKDQRYALNLAAILGNKPPQVEEVDPAKRVQLPDSKPKPPEKKPSVTLTLKPEPAPETVTAETNAAPETAETETSEETVASEKKPDTEPELKTPPKTTAKKPAKKDKPEVSEKKQIQRNIKRSKLLILADALDNSVKKNKNVTIYFLILCLIVLVHKMHMPHLYKTEFRPMANQPKGSLKKEFDKDDDRERYRACPFCKLTNPTTAEQCQHCGQYLK